MNHPLDGVRQKIIRAEEHLPTIRADIERCLGQGKVISERDVDDKRLFRFRPDIPAPLLGFSVIIGECLHDLRSALEYIVRELVLINNRTPSNFNQFPICLTHPGFDLNLRKDRLCGVSLRAKAVIERLQPYRSLEFREFPQFHPLWILSELNNIDKHRKLALSNVWGAGSEVQFMDHAGNVVATIRTTNVTPSGAETLIRAPDHIVNPDEMDVQFKSMFHVLFDDTPVAGQEVNVVMVTLVRFVKERVVPSFEKFFN
jgi:hypothetical protein